MENRKRAEFLVDRREAGQRDPETVNLLEICRNLEEAMKLGGGGGGGCQVNVAHLLNGREALN